MRPAGIEADRGAGLLTIAWEDGEVTLLDVRTLRWSCPCAECQGEWGRPGRLSGISRLPEDEFQLVDVLPVGEYAIAPIWASGHRSGIYSWELLRGLSP